MPVSPETQNAIRDYYTKLKVLNLHQPNPYTCQSTCIAMAVDYPHIENIRQRLEAIGDPGNPHVMADVIREFPVNYQLHMNACLDDVKTWLEEGDFLITQGWFTPVGHVICLAGLQIDAENNSYSFQVKDPWSEFNAPIWTYDHPNIDFYDGYYSSYCIYAACVASTSYADAKSIHDKRELDSSHKNMWVHRFMPKPATSSSQSASTSSSTSKTPITLQEAFEPLFNLISQGEGGPNAMNQGTIGGQIIGSTQDSQTIIGVKLTTLTLAELMKRQTYEMNPNNPQQNNYGVFAAGKFQFIPSTLKNLVASSGMAETKLFDVKTQNCLCLELIRTSANAAYRYVQGQSDDLDEAINQLATQWASLPTTSGGTAYAGTGNAASHSIDSVSQVLNEVRAKVLGQSETTSTTKTKQSSAGGGGGSGSKVYVVRAGDTLSGIASRFGIPLGTLEAANPKITNPNLITPGESLNIPES